MGSSSTSPGKITTQIVPVQKVLSITDLTEGVVNKASVLEGLVLNRYGTYDRAYSSANPSQTVKHYIINADVTDREGFATITVTCYGEAICSMFKDVLVPGKTIRLSGFTTKARSDGREHGDVPKSIRLHADSVGQVIPDFDPAVVLKFFTSEKICNFVNRSEDKVFLHPSLSVTVFDIFPEREDVFTVKVADGTSDNDIFLLEMESDRKNLYDDICEKVGRNSPPTLFLKNVLVNTYGQNHSFRIDRSTIVADVQGDRTKRHLEFVFRTLCASRAVHRQITGTLYVRNPAASAFRKLCGNCRMQNFSNQDDGTVCCFACNGIYSSIRVPRLECAIKLYDSSIVQCYAVGEEVRAVIDYSPEEFLDIGQFKKNELLSNVCFDGIFTINSINQLCGITPSFQSRPDIAGILPAPEPDMPEEVDNVVVGEAVRESEDADNDVADDMITSNALVLEAAPDPTEQSSWEEDLESAKRSNMVEGITPPRKSTAKASKGKRKLSSLEK